MGETERSSGRPLTRIVVVAKDGGGFQATAVRVFFHRDHVKKSLLPGSSQWFRNGVPEWRSSTIDKCANPTTFSVLAQLLVVWVLLRFCNEFVAIIKSICYLLLDSQPVCMWNQKN
jgi:hypothetical protein